MAKPEFSESSATRIITALETRAERKTQNGAQIAYTWGQVAEVDDAGKLAGAYLNAETDGAYISGGFRVPDTMYVSIGDVVKVAINYATGERWIEEAYFPPSDYKKIAIDIVNGQILGGNGTVPPTLEGFGELIDPLTLTDLIVTGSITLADSVAVVWDGDTDLHRESEALLATDNDLMVGDALVTAGALLRAAGSVELVGSSPYIDFKNDAADDYDARFVLSSDDVLDLSGAYLGISASHGIIFGGDVTLYRSAADTLKTNDRVIISRSSGGVQALDAMTDGEAASRLRILANGTVEWSDGTNAHDVNLKRGGADELQTDDNLRVVKSLRGGSSAFPASPDTDDRYYRTDLDMMFQYDGAQWLCTCPHTVELPQGQVGSFAATTSNVAWAGLNLHGGSDLYLIGAQASFFVNTGGTALGASHKWNVTIDKGQDSSATLTNIASMDLASGANGSRKVTAAINALLNGGTIHDIMRMSLTKTGTPGAVFVSAMVTYRVVAT